MAALIALSFIIIYFLKNGYCLDSPSFRIISPQNVCNSLFDNNNITKEFEGVVITFQPKNEVKLKYNFRVFFKQLESNFSQRETLIIWKAVRDLEYRINTLDRFQISSNNLIFINKSELISGVKYIFHVVGIKDDGESSRAEIFILNFSNGILQNDNIAGGLNLLLIGSNIAVASSSYVLYAKVRFCVPNYNYNLRWKIIMDEKFEIFPRGKSSILHIPKNSLIPGSVMKIYAQVVDSRSDKILAEDYITVEVVKKALHAYIFPYTAKIGVLTNLPLQIIILDYKIDNFKVIWEFYEANTKVVAMVEFSLDNNKCIVSFKKIGRYTAVAYVMIHNIKIKATAEIEVILNTLASFDFQGVPKITPSSNEIFTYSAIVSDLIPKCTAEWICVQEEGFEYVEIDELDNQNSGRVQIYSLEEQYLSEIIDMENVTESRDIKLYIPLNFYKNNKWKGLQGDKKYKFRLEIQCPMVRLENMNENSHQRVVSSNIEFCIHTNAPPKGIQYKVEPIDGYALETIFTITISEALDSPFDHPLYYELCGLFDGFELCFGKYMEYRHWEIFLPFTKTVCKLYIIICDIRNACNTVSGNNVKINSSSISGNSLDLLKIKIKFAFLRKDFMEALTDVTLISITLKNYKSKFLFDFKTFVHNILHMELDNLIESDFVTDINNLDDVLNIILHVKENLEILCIKDEHIQKKLIYIMERMQFKTNIYTSVNASDRNDTLDLLPFNLIKTYAEILLYLIEDTLKITYIWNNEGGKLVIDHVHELSSKICLQHYFSTEKMETSNISFILIKCKGIDLSKKDFFVSNSLANTYPKITITFRNINFWISESKHYCVVIILYSKDYIANTNYPVTYVRVYDLIENTPIMEWTGDKENIENKTQIIEIEVSKNLQETNMCTIWTNKNWSTKGCEIRNSNLNINSCCYSNLGFYRFYFNDRENIYKEPPVSKNIIATQNKNQNLSILSTMDSVHDFTMSPIMSTDNVQKLSTENSFYSEASTSTYVVIFATLFILMALLALFTYYRIFPGRHIINDLSYLYQSIQSNSSTAFEMATFFIYSDMKDTINLKKVKGFCYEKNPQLIERKQRRFKRSELNSSHGLTAEIYDQFYRDHKLLLKLFVYLGVMPIVRSAPGLITFNWKSSQMLYAFVLYICTSTIVIRIGYERIQILKTIEEFDEYIYAIIFLIFLVPHFWIPYVGWGVANQVAQYKTTWGSFQVRYYKVTGKTLTFPKLKFLITILFIGCVLLSLIFVFSLSRLLEGFPLWHTTAYFHIITMINMNAALFYINSRAIKRASRSLSVSFANDIKLDCSSTVVSQYRLLWLNVSEILQTFGNAYARTYSTYCLFLSINITVGAYGFLSEMFESGVSHKVLGLVVLTIYCASLLFIVCDCAERATSNIADIVKHTLLTVDLRKTDKQTHREIDIFISAIELNPPVVSLQGYGLINRDLLTADSANLPERIRLACAAGFRAVEIPYPNEHAEEVMRVKAETGVEISLINIAIDNDFRYGMACTPEHQEQFKTYLNKTVQYAKIVNCKKIHIMAGIANSTNNNEFLNIYKTNLQYADGILKESGIVGLIEPINKDSVPLYFLNCYDKALSILTKIDSGNLKLLVDIFHLQKIRGNITCFFKEFGDIIGHIQVAQVPHRHEPGVYGELDFGYIFSLINELGYDDWIGCEYIPLSSTVDGLKWVTKYGQQL